MILREFYLLLLFFVMAPFYGQETQKSNTLFSHDNRNVLLAKYSLTNVLYYYTNEAGTTSGFDFKDVINTGLSLDLQRQNQWSYEIGVNLLKAVYLSSQAVESKPDSN